MPTKRPGTTVRFGLFELDMEARELYRGSVRIRLAKQPFDLLIALIEAPCQVVTREALQGRLWPPDTFVDFDHGLNKTVRKLREALGDSAESPRYVETIQRIGYRFIAPVTYQAPPVESTPPSSAIVPDDPPVELESKSISLTRRNLIFLGGAALLGGGGIWLGRALRGPVRERAVNLVLPLPLGTGAADPGHTLGAPVVAPDGSAVIVSLITGDGIYLYIRRLDADHLVRMEGTAGGTSPFWSPDSAHVGFFSESKLKRMPVAGGEAMTLCDASGSRGGTWGTGGVILFGLNFHGIFQVPEAGGTATPITQLDAAAGENSHRNPIFLPDGVHFLYLARADDPEKRAIYMDSLKPGGSRQRIGVADGEFALGRDPETDSWYLLSQQAGKIVTQPFDIRRGAIIGRSRVLLDRTGTISASDTGILVLRTEQQMLASLIWVDRDGRQIGTVGEADDYWSVSISLNGQILSAVRHSYLTGRFKIWTASSQRGLLEPLSASEHAATAVWSSDSSIVYYTDIRSRRLLSHNLSASAPEEVAMKLDGSKEAIVDDISSRGDIVIAELIGDGAHAEIAWSWKTEKPEWHPISASGPQGLHAKLSHNGNWLASSSFETGRSEVYVMRFPDSGQRQRVSNDGGHTPRWRADGKELFYLAADGGMMSVSMAAGETPYFTSPRKLFQTNLRLGSDRPLYDITGDGQRFLLIDGGSKSRESDVEMVLHWPSLLVKSS